MRGAPCRKVPQLREKRSAASSDSRSGSSYELTAPQTSPVSIRANNPFKYLLRDTQPGQVAFAYYVMDSWERQSVGQYDDMDKFVKQCRKWWSDVPTVYRREYWSREQEYKR